MKSLAKPEYTGPIVDEFSMNSQRRVFVCVWVKPKYTIEHVLTLKAMVERNTTGEIDFYCLTDHDEAFADLFNAGITPLNAHDIGLPGWWMKVVLFDASAWRHLYKRHQPRIVFADLDVVITGPIDILWYAHHHTTAIANFGVNFRHSKYNSSLLSWDAYGPARRVHDEFVLYGPDEIVRDLHGDQCWFWRVLVDDVRVWPEDLAISYKYEARRTGLQPGTRVVVFHGDPKPWEVNDPFVKEHYRR